MVPKRIAVGVLLVILAGALMAAPGASPVVPTAPQLLFALGLVVVAVGLRYIFSRGESSESSPPAVEGPAELPPPGNDIESQLQTLSTNPLRPNAKKHWKETQVEVQTQLRSLAVRTLTGRYNLSAAEANRMLDAGTWSENPHAVAFFTGSYPDWTPSRVSLRQKHLSSRADIGKQAGHVIDELGAIERGERMLSESALTDSARAASTQQLGDSRSEEETESTRSNTGETA